MIIFGYSIGWLITGSLENDMIHREKEYRASLASEEAVRELSHIDLVTPKRGVSYDSFTTLANDLNLGPHLLEVKIWNNE